MHALVDTFDEIELPGTTLELPRAERNEADESEEEERGQRDGARAPRRAQGALRICCGDIGIMLCLR